MCLNVPVVLEMSKMVINSLYNTNIFHAFQIYFQKFFSNSFKISFFINYNLSLVGSSCGEHVHGDHLADAKDCSVFYRCVWGKLEKFSCPDHAVFNPILSVCDLPSAVPYCKVTM